MPGCKVLLVLVRDHPSHCFSLLDHKLHCISLKIWRTSLGDEATPFTLHGLRKLSIIELAEAGCTDAKIQAITGQSAAMVAFYRAKASRRVLSRAAQKRRE